MPLVIGCLGGSMYTSGSRISSWWDAENVLKDDERGGDLSTGDLFYNELANAYLTRNGNEGKCDDRVIAPTIYTYCLLLIDSLK
jgi:hypothetical protein